MRQITRKLISVIVVFIAFVCCLFVFTGCGMGGTVTVDGTVDQIRYNEDSKYDVCIVCKNDTTKYVFNKIGDVTADVFSSVKAGDTVSIDVSENYKNYEYAVIYKFSVNGSLLFDTTQLNNQHDINIAIVIISALIAMIIFAIGSILNIVRKSKTEKFSFTTDLLYRQSFGYVVGVPKHDMDYTLEWQREIGHVLGAAFTGGGAVGGLACWVLYLIGVMSINTAMLSIAFFIIAIIGGLCWYVCCNLYDGMIEDKYVKKRPFCKKQVARLSQIAEVNIAKIKGIWIVKIYDKNAKTLVSYKVYDEQINVSTIWLSFIENKLPMRIDVYGQSLYFVKNVLDSLYSPNVNVMLCVAHNGKKYNIVYKKSCCIVSNNENPDNVTTFKTIEEVYEKYMLEGDSLKIAWNKLEHCEVVRTT